MPQHNTTRCRGVRPIITLGAALITVASLAHASQEPTQQQDPNRIVALDPRWTVSFAAPPAASAAYDQDLSYVPLKSGELVAIALDDGEVKWKVALATSLTPATGDGLVYTGTEGAITALDQKTGAVLWRTPLTSPLAGALHWDSGWLFASTEAGEFLALNGQDGGIVWQVPLESPLVVPPSPSGDRVYLALRDERVLALDQVTGAIVWTFPLKQAITGLLALEDQLLVGTRANLIHSMSLTRGRIRWSQKAGADIVGTPLADEDHIYFAAFDNVIRALDRDSGNIKWNRKLPSRPVSGPLRAENVVLLPFVTTDIGAFDAATGKEAFTIRAVEEIGGVPFLRESARPTAPRLIAMSRSALQGFASRFEPPLAPLTELPGVSVKQGH